MGSVASPGTTGRAQVRFPDMLAKPVPGKGTGPGWLGTVQRLQTLPGNAAGRERLSATLRPRSPSRQRGRNVSALQSTSGISAKPRGPRGASCVRPRELLLRAQGHSAGLLSQITGRTARALTPDQGSCPGPFATSRPCSCWSTLFGFSPFSLLHCERSRVLSRWGWGFGLGQVWAPPASRS